MSTKRPGEERGGSGAAGGAGNDPKFQATVVTPRPSPRFPTDRPTSGSPSQTAEATPPAKPAPPKGPSRAKMPTQIGRYQVLERVGRGGMGVLYRGVDPVLDREVAIKVMLGDFSEDTEHMRPRFYREARSAAKLQHRNIVTIFEFAEDGSTPYIVMEFLRGMSLAARLETNPPLTLDDKLDIVGQLLAGLCYAHEQGVVHRDVKPANVFLLTDTSVKLLDFGIAKVTTSNLTKQGDMLGSPSYMAPEQVLGRDSLDGRADVFSTGVVLYELLAGRKPFEADAPTAIAVKILHEEPPAIETVAPWVPPRLAAIVHRALEKDPAKRYATAADFARDVQMVRRALQAGEMKTMVIADPGSTSARTMATAAAPPPPVPTAPPAREKGWMVPAAIAAGVMIIAAVTVTMMGRPRGRATDPGPASGPAAGATPSATVANAPDPPKVAATVPVPAPAPAPPPAAPAAAGVNLQVVSVPPGASISLDGRDTRLVTPASVVVRGSGTHKLRLSKRGFQPLDSRIIPADLEKGSVAFTLAELEPEVPAGAQISVTLKGPYPFEVVDGAKVLSPASASHLLSVAAGKKLRLVAREYSLNQTVSIDATPDRHVELHAPALGRLTIRSAFETCKVRIGDRDLGYPPINNIAIAAGSYQIDLACPNGQSKTGFVTVSPGQAARMIVQ